MRNIEMHFEVYSDQSRDEILSGFYEKVGLERNETGILNSVDLGRLVLRNNAVEAKRSPSVLESFRGGGTVNFKLLSVEKGTKIMCSIQPFTEAVFIKGAITISLFLILLTTFILYLMGLHIVSICCVLAGWLFTAFVLYNGLSYHRNQLKMYAKKVLDHMNILQ